SGAYTAGTTVVGIPDSASVRFTGSAPSAGALQVGSGAGGLVSSGGVEFSSSGGPASVTLASLRLLRNLTGTDTAVGTGGLSWGGGTIGVPRLEARGGMSMSVFEPYVPRAYLSNCALVNYGTATLTKPRSDLSTTIYLTNQAVFENRGTLVL